MSSLQHALEALRSFSPSNWGREDQLRVMDRLARDEEAAKLVRLSAQVANSLPTEALRVLIHRAILLTVETGEGTPFDLARLRVFDGLVRPENQEVDRTQWGKDFCT